ncbi:unnamed protein product [Ilex paraguariensis]|uniref:Pectinesterase n=1 Tax=Ilex paraguariensis TaxID=185542 RepID=A0ABC8TCT5_9AQUA
MNCTLLCLCVVCAAVLFLGGIHGGFADTGEAQHVITWADMRVDEYTVSLEYRGGRNRSRVIVVDKNGGGDSVTVQGAVDMVPPNNVERVKIYLLPGIYREKVYIPASKPYISLIGNPNHTSETVISWNNKASDKDEDGQELGTSGSASVTVESDYFCASGITFENSITTEPGVLGRQAVALRISSDRAMFYKVRFLGTQDTLFDDFGLHYFYQCYIQGSIDFIFGHSKSLYQDCVIHSIAKSSGAIAAHHRNTLDDDTGFSFVNCEIEGTGFIYLGRAWGQYSRAIYSYCNIHNMITPKGWSDWNDPSRQKTAVFGEYQCKGRGANRRWRVQWSKSLSDDEARPFLDTKYIDGEQWLSL